MQGLELKIPPPVLAFLIGIAMWAVARIDPPLAGGAPLRTVVGEVLMVAGVGLTASGAANILRARTTVNPLKPESVSALVTTGLYRYTRNPMYLGLFVGLIGWAIFLWSPWAVLGPLVLVPYLNRFQIAPEERILTARFGAAYAEYQTRVRRWL